MTARKPSSRRSPAARAAHSPALTAAFAPVRAMPPAHLAEMEHTTMYGAPALKLRGRFLACMAINKAAEPNTRRVAVGFDQREALIASEPSTYYLKDHYQSYPVGAGAALPYSRRALESLIREAWHFVTRSLAGRANAPGRRGRGTSARRRRAR